MTDCDTVLAQARQLTTEEQLQLRAELDRLLTPVAGPSARPGLEADLKVLDELAARIGAAWKREQSAAEAVSEQRRYSLSWLMPV